jgi:protein involved in polysaccharide export with SLBB domain
VGGFSSLAAALALLAAPMAGTGQDVAPRAQPVYPQAPRALAQPGAGLPPERSAMVDPDKKLSTGDQVTVEIVEDHDGGQPKVVTATGELDVPPLGRVKVAGRTTTEAARQIKLLLEKDYYYHADVRLAIDRVSPVQVRSGMVYLSGEVRMAGPMEMVSGETLTLSSAILKAGGITEWGKAKTIQLSWQKKDGSLEIIKVDLNKILKSGDARQDPILQDGDRIYVDKCIIRS